jgi:hypothetical protein
METCDICFEDKDKDFIIQLKHINNNMKTNKNINRHHINGHQMCIDCYKKLRINKCPFCRCEIKTITKINVIELQKKIRKLKYKVYFDNLPVKIYVPYTNYNVLGLMAGLGGLAFST